MSNKESAYSPDMLKSFSKEQLVDIILHHENDVKEVKEEETFLIYQKIFDESPGALMLTDAESRQILMCNAGAVSMFDVKDKGELLGSYEHLFHKKPAGIKGLGLHSANKVELEYVSKSKRSFWGLKETKSVTIGPNHYVLITIIDITSKKEDEQHLALERARLKTLIEYTDDLVWSIDKNLCVTEFNTEAYKAATRFADIHLTLNQSVFPTEKKNKTQNEIAWRKYFSRVLSGEKFTLQYVFHNEYHECYYEFHFHPIYHEDKEVIGATIFGRDITERIRQEEKLRYAENLFKSVVNTQHEMICRFQMDTTISFVNHACVRHLGRPMDRLIGKKFLELIPTGEHQEFVKELRKIAREGKPASKKYSIETAEGRRCWHHWTIIPIYSHDGILAEFQAAGLDITSRMMAEQKLKASEEKFRTLVLAAPVGIFLTDNHGYCTWTNSRLQEIGGFTFEEALGDGIFQNLYAEDRKLILKLWHKSREDQVLFHKRMECRYLLKSGEIKWIFVTFTPLMSEDQRVIGYVGIVEDVTERKQYEDELIETKSELEKALQSKDEFLSVMSHEIRTPLNAIVGLSQLLQEQDHLPLQKEAFSTLSFSSNHLLSLVNDILDFSKLQAGKLYLENIPYDVHELARQTVQLFQIHAHDKGVSLHLEIDDKLPGKLMGDPTRIGQVLNNLLSNAVKFTDKGTIQLSLAKANAREFTIKVKDSGIGMTKEEQDQIFEAFTQANSTTTRKYGGTGLGLTITKKLVNLLGGSLSLKSKAGKGTTFTISLPLNIAESALFMGTQAGINKERLKGLRILYVEDVLPNQFLMKGFCGHWGAELELASSGKQALEMLKTSEKYSIILMDIMMPGMDGYETSQQIRKMQGDYFKRVPIIAVTASVSNKANKKYLHHGMNDFIEKPIKAQELIRKILSNLPDKYSDANEGIARDQKNMFTLLDEFHAQHPREYINLLETSQNYIQYYRDLLFTALKHNKKEEYLQQSHKLINLLMHFKQDSFIELLQNSKERLSLKSDTLHLKRELDQAFERAFAHIQSQVQKSKNLLK